MTTKRYARLVVSEWIASIELNANLFGALSLRRTKAIAVYSRTGKARDLSLDMICRMRNPT